MQATCECGRPKDRRARVCRVCFETAPEPPTKVCRGPCGRELPIETYQWRPDGRGGRKRRSRCRDCDAAYARDWRATHPEAYAAGKREWAERNPEAHALGGLRRNIRAKGLDPDEVLAYMAAHDGRCDICGGPPTGPRLDIEHDHTTGRFRGLVCGDCNSGLARFHDDPGRMAAAIAYLAR